MIAMADPPPPHHSPRAMVDFRVPGKPSPPPTDLLLSIWIEFRIPSEGEVISKNTIEFTGEFTSLSQTKNFLC